MMKITLLTTWNATDGASYHAELIGRYFAKTHKLTVFAPTFDSQSNDPHHLPIGKDEDFVIRGFAQTWGRRGWVDDRLWNEDYDVLIVEALDRMPLPTLLERFPKIKAKKVQVVHEWVLPDNPQYYALNFDAIVCFDHRYKTMLLKRFSTEKIHIIPYPCHPWLSGNKEKAREKLGLPKNVLILFSFGRQPLNEYNDYLWLANELSKKYKLMYLVVRSDNQSDWGVVSKTLKRQSPFCVVRFERPLIDRVYDYLHAADIHLLPKGVTNNVVVSSTVFQCLGAGTPIVIPDTRYVEMLDEEIIKYRPNDRTHLKMQVLRLMKDENYRKATLNAAKRYVCENSAEKIGEMFIDLFLSL